jgi:hypothetical protein
MTLPGCSAPGKKRGGDDSLRFATGTVDDLLLEIYGRTWRSFHLMDPNWLLVRRPPAGWARGGERGWTRLETVQRYPGCHPPPVAPYSGAHPRREPGRLHSRPSPRRSFAPDVTDGLRASSSSTPPTPPRSREAG